MGFAGCGGDNTMTADPDGAGDDEGELPGPSRGSAVVLSADDQVAVMVNRDVGSVSVFELSYDDYDRYSSDGKESTLPTLKKTAEIDLGKDSEPWQAVISPSGKTAYVILRKDQQVVKISDLKKYPHEDGRVQVGSEPTGIAMTPSGKRLWVANWVDGTLNEIDAKQMKVKSTVDLNKVLAPELLGHVEPRPSLAHPRSVAITSNLNRYDDDESVLVTEYYGVRYQTLQSDGSNADTSLQGIVYKLDLGSRKVKVIRLDPLTDIGFRDQDNVQAGCYPNQLQSVTVAGSYAFVSSICASPKGQIGVFAGPAAKACMVDTECPGQAVGSCVANKCKTNCDADLQCGANEGKCVANVCAPNTASVKTATATVVSVIDIARGTEIKNATASLMSEFNKLFVKKNVPDDASRRFPAVPSDLAFIPKPVFRHGKEKIGETFAGQAFLTAKGADAVFPVKYDLDGSGKIERVGSDQGDFIDLAAKGLAADDVGKNPTGIAIGYNGRYFALVANEITRSLSVLDLSKKIAAGKSAVVQGLAATALPAQGSLEEKQLAGERFFETGTGRWSLKAQAWQSCESCHTDGLTDNVSWHFGRGIRQSIDLSGMFSKKNPNDQRILNWTAQRDEMDDFDNNTKGVSGGLGAIVFQVSDPPAAADQIILAKIGHNELDGSSAKVADPANPLGLAQPGVLPDWGNITEYARTIRAPRAPTNLDWYRVEQGKKLFAEANCAGCHGGDKWTISKVFFDPGVETNKLLSVTNWVKPEGFPDALLPAIDPAKQLLRFPAGNAAFDQLQCILRPVGTFDVSDGQAGVAELRQDMKTKSQGAEENGNGFNPPSLLGVQAGAPYLHSGGALTLESLFSPAFTAHHAALKPGFLDEKDPYREQKVGWLVQYLLNIDEATQAPEIPAPGPQGGDFCALQP
jgi:hypothetical protein